MEKQFVLNDWVLSDNEKIIEFLRILHSHNAADEVQSEISIHKGDENVLDEITALSNIQVEIGRSLFNSIILSICIEKNSVLELILILKKNNISSVLKYESLKLFLNDNDGDFVILDNRNKNYKQLKKVIGPYCKRF